MAVGSLPDVTLPRGIVRWLYHLLGGQLKAPLSIDKVVDVCLAYDEELTVEDVEDSLAAVDVVDMLTEQQFFLWVVLMFTEGTQDDFVHATCEFGSAAQLHFALD